MHSQIGELLLDLEAALRNHGLWQAQSPSREALASTEPFCIDTLEFQQWLQFVFLPKMHVLVRQQLPLPGACAIAPMAEEFFKGRAVTVNSVITALVAIDRVLTGAEQS